MRVIDIFMAMPSFIVALAIAGTLGASGKNLVLSMSFVYWAGYARLSRALTIQVKEQNYMMALKAGGCGHTRIIFRHVLRNIAPSIIALATMEIGTIILAIAGFSFIGLGVQPPTPEWGIMLSDSKNFIQTFPQLMIYPGIVIVIVVMAFNLLGEGMKMEWQENKVLKIQNLRVDFQTKAGTVQAVKGVNLTVPKGKITALVGESGSGKSVTSLAVLGLLPRNGKIVEGEITAEGMEFGKLSKEQKKKWNGSTVGMIFQDPSASLNPLYTVGNQMTEGIRQRQKMKKEEAEKLALSYLEAVKLPNPKQLMKKYPFELSGGMCQRVMIAIAMALEPKYLIADEPTTALDVTVQRQILSEIYRMSREQKMGILFITHDLGVVAEIADQVYIMQAGEIVEAAPVDEIFHKPIHPYTKKLLSAIL